VNTATFWPDWLRRLDRLLLDSGRWLRSVSHLTTTHIRLIEDAKRRLIALIGELKLLNRHVIGSDPCGPIDRIHDLQAALETAVQHIDQAVADCHREAEFASKDSSLSLISGALGDVEHRATLLLGPVKVSA